MKFTLIVATLGRSVEVTRLFESFLKQSYKNFEVIVVDQNPDNRVFDIYTQYKTRMSIQYIHTNQKGLSHARNLGLRCNLSDIIAFPDDDCWYPDDILEKVNRIFEETDVDCVTGRPVDSDRKLLVNNFLNDNTVLNFRNVWRGGISFTIFMQRKVVQSVGLFDEKLGVGAGTPYGSGEETDYLIRALVQNYTIKYTPDLVIFHPRKTAKGDVKEFNRALLYGGGMGYVLNKHNYPVSFKLKSLIRPLGGSFIALLFGNIHMCKFRLYTFSGRVRGLMAKI